MKLESIISQDATVKGQVAEILVSYRPAVFDNASPVISDSRSAVDYLLAAYDKETIGLQEQFLVMYLNRGNRVLGIYRASTGGMSGTVCDIRLILGVGLKIAASSLVVSHNHPSGNMQPSIADEELTQKLKKAAKTMDIKLLDHLILHPSDGVYFSFAEEGRL